LKISEAEGADPGLYGRALPLCSRNDEYAPRVYAALSDGATSAGPLSPKDLGPHSRALHTSRPNVCDALSTDAPGLVALHSAIAAYLQVARGINCSTSQIFTTSEYCNTLELIVHELLEAGDRG